MEEQLALIPKRRRLSYTDIRTIETHFAVEFLRYGQAIMPTTKTRILLPGSDKPVGYGTLVSLFKIWCKNNGKIPVYNRKRPEVKRSLWDIVIRLFRR